MLFQEERSLNSMKSILRSIGKAALRILAILLVIAVLIAAYFSYKGYRMYQDVGKLSVPDVMSVITNGSAKL